MKVIDYLRRSLFSCFANPLPTNPKSKKAKVSSSAAAAAASTSSSSATIKNRLSTSFADLFKDRQEEPPQEEDSLIDAAERTPSSPSRSVIVGTIFGHRRGRVAFCVQHDPAVPPPFLFELSIPTQLLVHEMRSGLLRLALECQRSGRRAWKAYCNGRMVGYAVRRQPTEKDRRVLETVQSTSAGAGVLFPSEGETGAEELGELMYMRATYQRVVGSRDSVSSKWRDSRTLLIHRSPCMKSLVGGKEASGNSESSFLSRDHINGP